MFWRLALATGTRLDSVVKNACAAQKGSFSILVSKRVFISFPRIQWLFFFNTIVLTHIIFNYFVTTFSIFKERFGFLSLTLYLSHLLHIPLGLCFSTDICISLDCTWVSNILVKSLCDFWWLFTDLLYLELILGH